MAEGSFNAREGQGIEEAILARKPVARISNVYKVYGTNLYRSRNSSEEVKV